jgi:hypothetical protein
VNRALPGWAVDVIYDGISESELQERGDRAVWAALRRTAMSAHVRGWPESEWSAYVLTAPRRLGQQVRLHRGKPRGPVEIDKQLRKAWTSAVTYLSARPAVMAAEEVARRGTERAAAALEVVADPAARMTEAERAVLADAAREILRLQQEGKNVDLAPMPRRGVARRTRLSERTARTALQRLTDRGLLQLAVPGRRGAPGAMRGDGRPEALAGLYRIPDPVTLARLLYVPVNGSVGRGVQVSGTPTADPLGTPAQISGTPSQPDQSEEPAVVTLTLTAPDAAALAAALAALRREGDVAMVVDTTATTKNNTMPDNVRPLRRQKRAS